MKLIIAERSRRASRKAHIEERHQKLKRLEREGREIYDSFLGRKVANRVPLDKPLFIGYRKTHVVRDDIARSPYGADAALVLPYVGHVVFCRRKEFTRKNFKTKKIEPIPHDLRGISEYEWKKDKLEEVWPERVKRLFKLKLSKVTPAPFSTRRADYTKIYQFQKPWWFDEKISRHYATHVVAKNGEAESAYKRIQNKLDSENWWREEYGDGHTRERDGSKDYRFWQDPDRADNWEQYLEAL